MAWDLPSDLREPLTPSRWRARPGSFLALMALYESNFLRLAALLPDRFLQRFDRRYGCRAADGCELVLSLQDRSPYTSTFTLTYEFSPEQAEDTPTTSPDMTVRVYHDAHLAEAREWAADHRHDDLRRLRSRAERELDQRWGRNVMLNKWLEYCADRGHVLRPSPR